MPKIEVNILKIALLSDFLELLQTAKDGYGERGASFAFIFFPSSPFNKIS